MNARHLMFNVTLTAHQLMIDSLRKAPGTSGTPVAAGMNASRNAVYQAERNERDGAITINQMRKLADAIGCKFVCAIVPAGSVENAIRAQVKG